MAAPPPLARDNSRPTARSHASHADAHSLDVARTPARDRHAHAHDTSHSTHAINTPIMAKDAKSPKDKKEKKEKKEKRERDSSGSDGDDAARDAADDAKKTKVDTEDTADDTADDDGFKVHTKSASAVAGQVSAGTYEDRALNCRDCDAEFMFTIGEQEFYATKGWTNVPTRCEPCKQAKKARFGEDKPACYAFQRGECDRGDSCRFSHGPGGGGGGGGGGFGRGGGGGGGGACYAFQRGECDRGDSCRFSHAPGGGGGYGGGGGRGGYGGGGDRPRGECYAFKEGRCDRGDSCRFSH